MIVNALNKPIKSLGEKLLRKNEPQRQQSIRLTQAGHTNLERHIVLGMGSTQYFLEKFVKN